MPERYAVVKVYVHVEDTEAPGYYVDIETDETVLVSSTGETSSEQFAKVIGQHAQVAAIGAARRLYDPKDPVYGRKEARA